ncbi:MAG: hypothetical protein Q4G16_11815 [Cruoricaptor ignavus]|nr:hypothetical protein [Cruoricaptor ignavus]
MKLFSKKHIIISIITFIIVFAMNYVGNEAEDKLATALMNAVAGVVGLSLGLFILYKNKDGKPHDKFD